MAIPKNITREHLLSAIEMIDNEGLPKNRDSDYYVIYNGKEYPPKVIISFANIFANTLQLDSHSFNAVEARKYLKKFEFDIVDKHSLIQKKVLSYWIEKTIIRNRPDRIEGERARGKALWSPKRDKRGADIYGNMRQVTHGDIIIHLIDNLEFSGVSTVRTIENDTVVEDNYDGYDTKNFKYVFPYTGLWRLTAKATILTEKSH
jgi:hypothetical protein